MASVTAAVFATLSTFPEPFDDTDSAAVPLDVFISLEAAVATGALNAASFNS